MSDLPLSTLRDLELRYDGPIPPQHVADERRARRRNRGTLAVLEAQATRDLDDAERCAAEMEDIAGELETRALAAWQREAMARRHAAAAKRFSDHLAGAASAIARVKVLRADLGLPPHPVTAVMERLTGT
jgi:hypothetical protein